MDTSWYLFNSARPTPHSMSRAAQIERSELDTKGPASDALTSGLALHNLHFLHAPLETRANAVRISSPTRPGLLQRHPKTSPHPTPSRTTPSTFPKTFASHLRKLGMPRSPEAYSWRDPIWTLYVRIGERMEGQLGTYP